MEVSDEVESLLPGLDNVQFLVRVRVFPLNVTAWLNQHEGHLMREVALANRENKTVLLVKLRLVLVGFDRTFPQFLELNLLNKVELFDQDVGAILDILAEIVTSEDGVGLIDPENLKPELLCGGEALESDFINFDVEHFITHIFLHVFDISAEKIRIGRQV